MTTPRETTSRWTDQKFLREVQYGDSGNLAARQAIYAFQVPRINIWSWALDLAGLHGDKTVVDVGCGNGRYLGVLRSRRHAGLVLGVDLSDGMLRGITAESPGQPVVQADAAKLPLAPASADVVLAMHMLYHVPAPEQAVAELRRALRPGGRALVLLNGAGHLAELRQLVRDAAAGAAQANPLTQSPGAARLDVDAGEALLAPVFSSVERHEVSSKLMVPDPDPVIAYVASMNALLAPGLDRAALLAEVRERVERAIGDEGVFGIQAATGCLVCS